MSTTPPATDAPPIKTHDTDNGTPSDTMLAVTQDTYGSADVLTLRHVPRPTVAADEVLIEVVAAGLDRGVWHLMTGQPWIIRVMGYGFTKPKHGVLGMDVAGRVVAVGRDVTRFGVGDEVFGIGTGTFAQFATAKASKITHKPANVSFEEAAVATISGITALQAVTTVGKVSPGQHVLVLGAAGAVGSFVVQLAKGLGATVTGVASTAKLDAVRALGADHVLDYTVSAIDDGDQRYDVIIDTGGRATLRRLRRALTPTGTLVIVGGEGGNRLTGGFGRQLRAALWSPLVKQRLTFFTSSESLEFIEPLADQLASGAVTATIGQTFALDEVADALVAMEAGSLVAKTAIIVST
jgi:NADPH:quinone reductase-like Zn-dependent oxidoreductase